MRYVVQCHTRHLDRSADKNSANRDVIRTHTVMRSVNRADAVRMVDRLNSFDDGVDYEDGPFIIQRAYEVAAELFTSTRNGSRKIILSLSEMEMIASEVTQPDFSKLAAD